MTLKNWDLWLIAAVAATIAASAVLVPPLASYARRPAGPAKAGRVTVECARGNCWLRPQGSLSLYRLPPFRPVEAFMGDEAMTLGEGSSLVVNFQEESGELRLANTGVIRIAKGQQDVSVNDPAPSAGGGAGLAAQVATPSSLVYVGEIPIKIVSPAPGTPIVATVFPARIHLAFLLERLTPESLAKLTQWSVVAFDEKDRPSRLQSLSTGHTEPPVGGASFFADFEITQPGRYALVPAGMDMTEANLQFRFEVKGADALEEQLTNLLQGVSSDSNQQMEIRGQ